MRWFGQIYRFTFGRFTWYCPFKFWELKLICWEGLFIFCTFLTFLYTFPTLRLISCSKFFTCSPTFEAPLTFHFRIHPNERFFLMDACSFLSYFYWELSHSDFFHWQNAMFLPSHDTSNTLGIFYFLSIHTICLNFIFGSQKPASLLNLDSLHG